jgi:hypothetical protein
MKTIMLAAAALTLGMGVAFADGGEGPVANTQFNQLPGVVAQAQQPNSSALAQVTTRQTAPVLLAYVTTTRNVTAQEWNQNQGAEG